MPLIYVCSPYKGDMERNTARAQRYCRFVVSQGGVPYAHIHNTQFLQEEIPEERQAGIWLGLEMLRRADAVWAFGDYLTTGMRAELELAMELRLPMRFFTDTCEEKAWEGNALPSPGSHGSPGEGGKTS